MLDLFTPMPADAQSANRAAYRQFIFDRDGQPDFAMRTLSRREEGMRRYTRPLSTLREIDRSLFHEEYPRLKPRRTLSREALLLMTLVKINAAEAYGVERTLHLATQRAQSGPDEVELLLHIEESYHTRILLSTALLYGIELQEPFRPASSLRTLIAAIAHAPELVARALTFAGEIVGTITFLNVLDATREILRHDPELRDAIEERVLEVLTDEIGHISFNRMVLGPAGVASARLVLPIVAEAVARTMPVLGLLGVKTHSDDAAFISTSSRLPEVVRKAAFVA
jgi:hypothetical protein